MGVSNNPYIVMIVFLVIKHIYLPNFLKKDRNIIQQDVESQNLTLKSQSKPVASKIFWQMWRAHLHQSTF